MKKKEKHVAARLTRRTLSDKVLRFQRSEIRMHWAIAAPFLVCYTTALILVVFYNPDPQRPFREVFSWIHRISGLCLLAFPVLVLVTSRSAWNVHLGNIRQAWIWTLDDVKWLLKIGAASINKRISLPDQGKFNAGEKMNFMMVMTTYPLFIITGVLIWLPGIAFYSWLAHFVMAVVATPLMLGHIFMATINPDTRKGLQGMLSGLVDRTWAKHHYRIWYRENFEKRANQRRNRKETTPAVASRDSEPVHRRKVSTTRPVSASEPGRSAKKHTVPHGAKAARRRPPVRGDAQRLAQDEKTVVPQGRRAANSAAAPEPESQREHQKIEAQTS